MKVLLFLRDVFVGAVLVTAGAALILGWLLFVACAYGFTYLATWIMGYRSKK